MLFHSEGGSHLLVAGWQLPARLVEESHWNVEEPVNASRPVRKIGLMCYLAARQVRDQFSMLTISEQYIDDGPDYLIKHTLSYPQTRQFPGDSISKIASAAFSVHGRWAPTSAQPIPSRMRYLALVWTSSGILFRDNWFIQEHKSFVTLLVLSGFDDDS